MVTRIVKLTLKQDFFDDFINNFYQVQPFILKMKGCSGVKLHRDLQNEAIFFTISSWDTEADLDAYRHTDLFRTTWTKVKLGFAAKAEAWSLTSVGN